MKHVRRALLATLFILLAWYMAALPAKGDRWVSAKVKRGDTLWSYAAEYAPRTDPRAYVDRVLQKNGKESADLSPGERILLWKEARP